MLKLRTEKGTEYLLDRDAKKILRPGLEVWDEFIDTSEPRVGEPLVIQTRSLNAHGFGARIATPTLTEVIAVDPAIYV